MLNATSFSSKRKEIRIDFPEQRINKRIKVNFLQFKIQPNRAWFMSLFDNTGIYNKKNVKKY